MQDEEGRSSLMLAASAGDEAVVSLLLERGAPWNATDCKGRCAGDYAAAAGHEQVFNTIVDAGEVRQVLSVRP